MRLLFTLLFAAVISTACGGGGDSSTTPSPALDTNTPPTPEQMTGPAFTSDVERMRAGRQEGWRPGYAMGESKVPDALKAAKPDIVLEALGDPVQRPMGETVPVAPVPTTIPADARTKGMWSHVYDWPLIPIHMSMLPDGRLMSYGTTADGRQTGSTIYDVYDPAQGLFSGHMTLPNGTGTDIFCSTQLFLPIANQLLTIGGDNFVNGWTQNTGNNNSTLYTPGDNSLVRGVNMNRPRWYASGLTLSSGETFIMGGLGGADRPEVRGTTGTFRLLGGADTSRLDYWYPRLWNNWDGRVFGYDSYGNYYYVNPTGNGALQIVNQWDVNRFGETGSAVMYRPGRILQLAGYSSAVSLIDIRGTTPTMTPAGQMTSRRQTMSASVVPNGQVIVTGGSEVYNELAGANKNADIWDPTTGAWTVGATGNIARLYHSINLLMPDGTILVGGGGAWGPLNNLNVEFYYPPYLFNSSGGLATRPIIDAAPTTMELGKSFTLTVSDSTSPITRVTMIKTGSVTHGLNPEQNFNELSFTRSGDVLTVTAPTNSWDANPGYYMVFALNAAGVPSLARIIKVDVAGSMPVAPTNLSGSFIAGTGARLTWTQSTSTGVTQNIIARGTSATGPFTNIATIAASTTYTDPLFTNGTFYYVVKAVNANGASPNSNVATVAISTSPPPTSPPGAITGLTATFASGVNLAWTNPTGQPITSIAIQRRVGTTGTWGTVATLTEVRTTHTDPLTTAGTYNYRAQAVNSAGSGPFSSVASVTIPAAPPPAVAAPTGLSGYTCGAGCWTTDTGIRFNWTRSVTSGVTQYAVQRSTTGANGPWTVVATLGDVNVYVDKNVTAGTTYWYGVQAIAGTASSNWVILNYGVTSNITLGGTPPPPTGFSIVSQEQTKYLVMNWWRGDPAAEGANRQPGICTGVPPAGNCFLGARKTFRPMAFNIASSPATVAGLIMMDVPQFENGVKTFDHYRLPVEFVRSACTFKVRHVRTHGSLEFPLNPPGLEILDHTFTLTQSLCDSYPAGAMTQAWLNQLNVALDAYLGPKVAYNPIAYPYNDPRSGKDPSQP